MNDGKICISVCAETADEIIEKAKRAESLADVIEIRFDCLSNSEFNFLEPERSYKILSKILTQNYQKPILQTFRPNEQGGNRKLTLEERYDFWNSGEDFGGGDFEEDVVENHLYWLYHPVICSYHDFKGVPANLIQIYERIKNIEANIDVIKIAVQTNDITDSIAVWRLLEKFKADEPIIKAKKLKQYTELNKKLNQPLPPPESFLQIIPIAMGESGKWTRILGLAHGAFMTYASLEAGGETAPGQVSAKDLLEVYRAKELDENTEVYGIIGGNTSYSMSPFMHNAAFKFHDLNSVFVPLQTQNLDEFMRRMVKAETREIELNFKGFSVTNPHKQKIIKHLDFIDETAQKIGAVNTVKILDGKLHGYNTDAQGFIEPLLNSYGDLSGVKAAVIGAGGAARACIYALQKHGAKVTVFARDIKKAKDLADDFQIELQEFSESKVQSPKSKVQSPKSDFNSYDILVNTTPLGTKGELETETPATAEQFEHIKLAYDLIYNPFQTKFMQEAAKVHVPVIGGLAMLAAQAAAQQKIWTNLDAPVKEMSAAVLRRL